TASNAAPAFGAPQIERKILDFFRGGASLSSAVQNIGLLAVAKRDYEQRLRRTQLIPDAAIENMRWMALALAILALAVGARSQFGPGWVRAARSSGPRWAVAAATSNS